MLWLPKWLRDEQEPASEGVSRRTFLFLGAAAGVGLMLPPSGVVVWDELAPAPTSSQLAFLAGRRGGKSVWARVHITRHAMEQSRLAPAGSIWQAMVEEQRRFFESAADDLERRLSDDMEWIRKG